MTIIQKKTNEHRPDFFKLRVGDQIHVSGDECDRGGLATVKEIVIVDDGIFLIFEEKISGRYWELYKHEGLKYKQAQLEKEYKNQQAGKRGDNNARDYFLGGDDIEEVLNDYAIRHGYK